MPGYTRQFLAPFIGGLNTELPQTQDALQYTSDELNCTILREGMRGRRYGFNIEKDGKWTAPVPAKIGKEFIGSMPDPAHPGKTIDLYTETYDWGRKGPHAVFFWKNVNKTDADYVIIQEGYSLYIYNSSSSPLSENLVDTISFGDFVIDTSGTYTQPLKFATGAGFVLMSAPYTKLMKLSYDEAGFHITEARLKVRDIQGLDDGYKIDERPTRTLAVNNGVYNTSGVLIGTYDPATKLAKDSSGKVIGFSVEYRTDAGLAIFKAGPNGEKDIWSLIYMRIVGYAEARDGELIRGNILHLYNLYNQGWRDSEINAFLSSTETLGTYPANNMQWFVGKDQSGNFGSAELLKHYFGNTPAPKGHYIIDFLTQNRGEVSTIPGTSSHASHTHAGGIYKEDRQYKSPLGSGAKSIIHEIPDATGTIRGFTSRLKLRRKSGKREADWYWDGNITFTIYGRKDYVTDYEPVASGSFRASSYREVNKEDIIYTYEVPTSETAYIRYKIEYKFSQGNGTSDIPNPAEYDAYTSIYLKEDVPVLPETQLASQDSYTDISFLGGHYFYLCGDTVLFSQTVKQDGSGYDKCYQDADPTSEEISDIIATDGGYIKFPTMGNGLALESFNRGVIVFGRDVVYGIMNTATGQFTAVDYDTVEISRAGLASRMSVVSTADQVFYWSPLGIFSIGMNPQTDNTVVAQSISQKTIQYWYNRLPDYSKNNCRGAYDYINNRIYWLFPTDSDNLNNLNGGIIYDLNYGAFMPLEMGTGENGEKITSLCNSLKSNLIEPTVYVKAGGNRVIAGDNKVVVDDYTDPKYDRYSAVVYSVADKDGNISFGDFNDREFHDWQTAGYDSYLLSRPITGGDTFYNKQTPILQTLFKRTEEYKLLKKPEEDPTNVKYALKNMEYRTYIEQGGDEHLVSRTKVLNTGIAKNLEVVVDYTAPGVSSLTVSVRDIDNYLNIIGSKTITDVHQRNVITLDEFANTECKGYWIICEGLTGDYSIEQECTGTFYMHRTDMSERQFICYEAPQTVTETKVMSKEFDLVLNEGGMDMIGDLRVSYKPITNTPTPSGFFSYDFNYTVKYGSGTYSGNSTNWLNIQSSPGFTTNVKNISFKDLTYVDRGIPTEKIAFDTVETAEFKYSYTVYRALFKEEDNYEMNPVEYTTPSGAYLRMRWGWSLEDKSNRWDMVQNAYRPQKDFLHDEFVESRVHIRGRGKAYQVEVRNDDNKDFRLSGMNVIIRSPN